MTHTWHPLPKKTSDFASRSPALRQHFASTSPANDQQIATQKNEEQENEELEIIMYASINLSFAVLFSGSFRTLL